MGNELERACVYVVDDDLSMREALSSLVRSVGLAVETFASASEFLAHSNRQAVSCLVLDVRMAGISGLELQTYLTQTDDLIPIIFITGHGDIPMAVHAIKQGALEFLPKPFSDQQLLTVIDLALDKARQRNRQEQLLRDIRRRYDLLTLREKEVIVYIVKGSLNKQAAAELGISEMTIKVHRHHIMQKMGVRTVPDLVRMVERLGDVTLPA